MTIFISLAVCMILVVTVVIVALMLKIQELDRRTWDLAKTQGVRGVAPIERTPVEDVLDEELEDELDESKTLMGRSFLKPGDNYGAARTRVVTVSQDLFGSPLN